MAAEHEFDADIFAEEATRPPAHPKTSRENNATTAHIAESVTSAIANLKLVDALTKLHVEDIQPFFVDRRKETSLEDWMWDLERQL